MTIGPFEASASQDSTEPRANSVFKIEEGYVDVSGVLIYYKALGSGPPLMVPQEALTNISAACVAVCLRQNFDESVRPDQTLGPKQNEPPRTGLIGAGLFDADDHGIWTDEVFDSRFPKTRFFHPTHAVSTRVIKTAFGFD